MIVRKLTNSEKFFLLLLIHIVLFGGIFALGLLGVTTNAVLLILGAVVSLEIIYLAVFIQQSLTKNARSLEGVEKQTQKIEENEEKAQTALIYLGHQLKSIQHDLDAFKKGSFLKYKPINGHRLKAHA